MPKNTPTLFSAVRQSGPKVCKCSIPVGRPCVFCGGMPWVKP